ncbi:11648_t:CDS:2, partial [Dentiscutata erythropus]
KILSQSKLKNFGFCFSNDQFKTAVQKANQSLFLLTNYQRLLITKHKQNFEINEVYFLEKSKHDIYFELKSQYPDIKLSLSLFYKLCLKNFKKAQKKTDMCQVYIKGQQAEKKLQQLTSIISTTNPIILENLKEMQLIEHITSSSCIIVMDFKENIRIGGGSVKTKNNFFEKL